jgi:hypothetical protein
MAFLLYVCYIRLVGKFISIKGSLNHSYCSVLFYPQELKNTAGTWLHSTEQHHLQNRSSLGQTRRLQQKLRRFKGELL